MRIETDVKLDFSDVLIKPKRSTLTSREDVSLVRDFSFRNSGKSWFGVPIIAANMDTVGTFEAAKELMKLDISTCIHKHYSDVKWGGFVSNNFRTTNFNKRIFYTSGISAEDLEKMEVILENHRELKMICLDIANGYIQRFVDTVRMIRKKYPHHVIMAGNVVTGEMTEELILSGADIVKVGIGPGGQCTTRIQTGVGHPQLSAIIECADAAHGLNGHIVADGGITCPGDMAKAFGAGADFVMVGSQFAAHDENTSILDQEQRPDGFVYAKVYGMSSRTAQEKYKGMKEYRASEGRTTMIRMRGPIKNTAEEFMGGVRSTLTYVGAKTLKELSKRTTFIMVNRTHNQVHEKDTVGK